jgi:diguanylate cyclase (GGDEF)-like protein
MSLSGAFGALSRFRIRRSGSWLDQALYAFSVYAVPALIALGALIAMLFLPREFPAEHGPPLAFHVFDARQTSPDPAEALARLAGTPAVASYHTHLSETPIWFSFVAAPAADPAHPARPALLELPSRHARSVQCWRARDLHLLGTGDRVATSGRIRTARAGFALSLGRLAAPETILCEGRFSGPAELTVLAWTPRQLRNAELDFQQSSGLIAGGLLTLAVFVFVTALINREWTYVIFAVWLVGNLRLCANAMGWDGEWLGRVIPAHDLALLRKLSFAAYYLLTGALFSQLFRRELLRIGYQWLLRAAQYAGLLLLALAVPLSYGHFELALWGIGGFGISVLIFLLGRLVWKARSRTVMWYVASLAVVLVATLSEVFGAVFGISRLAAGVSPVLAALTSSMMAAFAIAEQMRAERERRRRIQSELRNTYEVTPIGLFTLDETGRFVRANPALRAMLDLRKSGYRERHWKDYFEPGAWGALLALAHKGSEGELELAGSPAGGTGERRYSLKATRANGWIEGSLQDVTERSKAVERLRFLSGHDPLTGVLNRRGLELAIGAQSEEPAPWALAYIDLARFKLVNDLFGHRAGDEVLRQVVARIQALMRADDAVGRIGGDEFICVMRRTTIDEAVALGRELIAAIGAAPYQVGQSAFQMRASIGIVECATGVRVQDALSHADAACRKAKHGVQGQLVAYRKGAPAFEERARELMLVETLGQNRVPEGLFLVMQPIMSLDAPGASLDFEVLLRWRAADGSTLPAHKVIAAAEESGNITAIDRWVLASVLAWLEQYHAALSKTHFVCVNLSGGSLNDGPFLDEIFALFARYRAVVHYLCLEITEGVALHDLANTQRFIARVHEMGAKIALDDFGAGYTSFRYLKELSADALKIDGEFVRTMCAHPADTAIVEAIVALARNLGMRSIAEWVEDAVTLQALRDIGVDYVQGFAVAEPQEGMAILAAHSAAAFIRDPATQRFVEQLMADADAGVDEQARVRADLH